MADHYVKKGDLLPAVQSQLTDGTGAPVPLGAATGVRFTMRHADGAAVNSVDAAGSVVDAATGRVQYAWQAADTDVPGPHLAEWVVAFGAGEVRFPNDGYLVVVVADNLG